MKSTSTIRMGLDLLKARIGVDGLYRELGDDLPLRSELFSITQLEDHAVALARWHQLDPSPGPDRLLARLRSNERILLEAYELVTEAVDKGRRISPASEWLLDNFYLIEEQIRTARRHLPKGYSRELPRLLNGPAAGYPRVYDIALELISHVDGRVDAGSLECVVAAYQTVAPLKLGELWAVPIMMRQALIENLRRVAARIAHGKHQRNRASHWADRFLECAEREPRNMVLVLAEMARSTSTLSSPFVAELARRLQGQGPTLAFPLSWIEQQLSDQSHTVEQAPPGSRRHMECPTNGRELPRGARLVKCRRLPGRATHRREQRGVNRTRFSFARGRAGEDGEERGEEQGDPSTLAVRPETSGVPPIL